MYGNRSQLDHIRTALAPVRGESSDYDLTPGGRPRRDRLLRPASVLVPLVDRGRGLKVLLTRRADQLAIHPGQVSFPGGKQDARDRTPLDAALREALEEIGLRGEQISLLGELDSHETVTGFRIRPFVGVIEPDFVPVLDRNEVDEVFEVPFSFLVEPANLQVHERDWGGQKRRYYAIPYGPHYIWGATARMIRSLSERLRRK